jgi:hypothetical protein
VRGFQGRYGLLRRRCRSVSDMVGVSMTMRRLEWLKVFLR